MCVGSREFADKIARLCLDFFSQLPKTGKPTVKEWTILTCIVQSRLDGSLQVVSLGTGTKCIGRSKMSPNGDILNDSHSEVMARRGFLRYIYEQINKAHRNEESIFTVSLEKKCIIKCGVEFHFFSTQTPCGDASIIRENKKESLNDDANNLDTHQCEYKKRKLNNSEMQYKFINNTGAKKLDETEHCPLVDVTSLGSVRTKPGRGDRTLSASCSDKLARWIRVGIQGALLQLLLEKPVSFHSIIISSGIAFSYVSFYRCLIDRRFDGKLEEWDTVDIDNHLKSIEDCCRPLVVPIVRQSSLSFEYNSMDDKNPSDCSIVWCDVSERPLEIAVAGKKQGATKKNITAKSSSLSISKMNLLHTFMSTMKYLHSEENSQHNIINFNEENTYKSMKLLSKDYLELWSKVKNTFFGAWPIKQDLLNFTVDH